LPAPLDDLVRAALRKDPPQRPTARDLLLALTDGNGGEAAVAAELADTWSRPRDISLASEALPTSEAVPISEALPAPDALPTSPTPSPPARWPRRIVVAGGTALALAGAVAALALRPNGAGGQEHLARSPAHATRPAPLPAAPLLVRLDTAAGWPNPCHADIASTLPGAKRLTTLSSGPACDIYPRWSPDRQRIAFTRRMYGPSEAWVMNADGTGRILISNRVASYTQVSWAPDSSRVAYQGYDGDFYTTIVGGSTPPRLTGSGDRKSDPVWSPDGRGLAFLIGAKGNEQIYVLDMRNPQRRRRLTSAPQGALDPAWSPNGKQIAFTQRTPDGSSDIWVMNADGTGRRRIGGTTAEREFDPSWSPDGTWIAYSRGAWGAAQTWAMRADGTGRRAISVGTPYEGHPNWS
jgi:Tol biopolymer transport system component